MEWYRTYLDLSVSSWYGCGQVDAMTRERVLELCRTRLDLAMNADNGFSGERLSGDPGPNDFLIGGWVE